MRSLAAGRFELDRSVGNVEAVAQRAVDAHQNFAALRHRHLGDGHMAGQCVRARTQRPYMQIMHVKHAVDRLHRGANVAELHTPRRALQQNIQRLAHNPHRAVNDHARNQNRKRRVDPRHRQ